MGDLPEEGFDVLEAADLLRKERRENPECRDYPPVGFTCKEAGFSEENWCGLCGNLRMYAKEER